MSLWQPSLTNQATGLADAGVLLRSAASAAPDPAARPRAPAPVPGATPPAPGAAGARDRRPDAPGAAVQAQAAPPDRAGRRCPALSLPGVEEPRREIRWPGPLRHRPRPLRQDGRPRPPISS